MFGARFHDEEMEGATKGKEFRRIISFFRNKPLLITSLIISGITGGSSLLGLLVMEDGVSMFMDALSFLDNAVNMIKKSAWITAIMIFLQVLSGGIQSIVAPLFLVDIRKQLYDSLMHADISFFDHTSSGALVGRLSEGVAYIQDVYVNTVKLPYFHLVCQIRICQI
ncbi:ATP-binding cassette transporter [Tritrichomonas foetus]|uniref:ATP-binding cassette transporter n=1 Tax=Tritrichomonas foetus TaxID=1144522 RepID=A0A1J4JW57_9EUKA|nr:ATP-binding cassette transporter [Tritrichomonas foetus]|eukprot:OHT02946.1 ATP-binding cassette transporter [Tritrichomonas foetus]